jgi:hypothetical protein
MRTAAATLALVALLTGILAGQTGELRETRRYDGVVDATSERIEMTLQPDATLHLEVTVVYEGRTLASTPRFVELLVRRDFASAVERAAAGDEVTLLADGRRLEREGASNPRDIDRRQTAARALPW